MRFRTARGLMLVSLLAASVSCRRAAPDAAPAVAGAPTAIEVLKGGRWLFTYAEPSGDFATTDKPETVPEGSRGLVRVLDVSQAANGSGNGAADGRVYVTSVDELVAKGKSSAKAMSREAFETAALAALPGGQSSPYVGQAAREPGRSAAPGATPAPTAQPPSLAPGQVPVVTIYGTSWCGACRAARQYLTDHKIPFADKDIERDPAAARELADKASKMGIPTDRVPILDVRGRLLLGFDPERVQALLGQPT